MTLERLWKNNKLESILTLYWISTGWDVCICNVCISLGLYWIIRIYWITVLHTFQNIRCNHVINVHKRLLQHLCRWMQTNVRELTQNLTFKIACSKFKKFLFIFNFTNLKMRNFSLVKSTICFQILFSYQKWILKWNRRKAVF